MSARADATAHIFALAERAMGIARALAAVPADRWEEQDWCQLCERHVTPPDVHAHAASCPWRMAREWAQP